MSESTTPQAPEPDLAPVAGYYLCIRDGFRPAVCEYDTAHGTPHWRNAMDNRLDFDPRDEGWSIFPIGHSSIPTAISRRDATIAALTARLTAAEARLAGAEAEIERWKNAALLERRDGDVNYATVTRERDDLVARLSVAVQSHERTEALLIEVVEDALLQARGHLNDCHEAGIGDFTKTIAALDAAITPNNESES